MDHGVFPSRTKKETIRATTYKQLCTLCKKVAHPYARDQAAATITVAPLAAPSASLMVLAFSKKNVIPMTHALDVCLPAIMPTGVLSTVFHVMMAMCARTKIAVMAMNASERPFVAQLETVVQGKDLQTLEEQGVAAVAEWEALRTMYQKLPRSICQTNQGNLVAGATWFAKATGTG